jgi:two-component system nitrogen regulation sensor histidine kinase NtrY
MGSERPGRPAFRPARLGLPFERRLLLAALAGGAPAVAAALILVWSKSKPPEIAAVVTAAISAAWILGAIRLRDRVVRPLQTLSNLLVALREEDFSFRARVRRPDDALGLVLSEVNALEKTLREQRLGAVEAGALLRTVMSEIDVAVFAFDGRRRLRLVNRAGARLLGRPEPDVLGLSSVQLGLDDLLEGEIVRTLDRSFPGGAGRWSVRRGAFREGGIAHQLLVLADMSQAFREEERLVWERLLRVLGHEVNNSLAPIKSISESLTILVGRQALPAEVRQDVQHGLSVMASRAEALSRFLGAYSRLARLPKPKLQPVSVGELVERVASLETRRPVAVRPGPRMEVPADPDQLEQVLINLLRNAVDAVLEGEGGVRIGWRRTGRCVEILVEDDGPGLTGTENVFIPFFTTKPGGSGIGLVLSRQIAEAHGGSLLLGNRAGARGCEARLLLPLAEPPVELSV